MPARRSYYTNPGGEGRSGAGPKVGRRPARAGLSGPVPWCGHGRGRGRLSHRRDDRPRCRRCVERNRRDLGRGHDRRGHECCGLVNDLDGLRHNPHTIVGRKRDRAFPVDFHGPRQERRRRNGWVADARHSRGEKHIADRSDAGAGEGGETDREVLRQGMRAVAEHHDVGPGDR